MQEAIKCVPGLLKALATSISEGSSLADLTNLGTYLEPICATADVSDYAVGAVWRHCIACLSHRAANSQI